MKQRARPDITARADAFQARITEGDNLVQAGAERIKSLKWSDERGFLANLKAVHETQRGVPLSYRDYPVTRTGGPGDRWQYTPRRQRFSRSEAAGSFCLGTSRGMAVRALFGLAKPSYFNVLTDLKTQAESARRAGDRVAEAQAIISRIASHLHEAGSLKQFNADLESRYGIKAVLFKHATRAEALEALDAGAPVLADVTGGWHWIIVTRSPRGALWASDPLYQARSGGLRRISMSELGSRFEIIVDATSGKPITPTQADSYQKIL